MKYTYKNKEYEVIKMAEHHLCYLVYPENTPMF